MGNEAALVDAFVAVGSNIEPEKHIVEALALLSKKVRVKSVSTFYRTEALGPVGQPDYRNGVVGIETRLAPLGLKFDILRRIEFRLGRVRGDDQYAARTIDLDVVIFGASVIDGDDLTIPAPEIRERPFVAVPLLELAPDMTLPDTGESLAALPSSHRHEGLCPDLGLTQLLRERLNS